MITVFTPTYNRAYIIGKLYKSLCVQSNKEFEWLIVDDGSTDTTKEIIQSFIDENIIRINYIFQENGGKHRAINRGVHEATGELFFIVDSDDIIPADAIQIIYKEYNVIKDHKKFAGICGLKAYMNGNKVGGEEQWTIINASTLDARHRHKIKGDLAEIFKIEVLKEFPFPDIEGEKFTPESLVWNRIAQKYILRYFYQKIYFCEYLEDGLSAQSVKSRMKNNGYATLLYSELINCKIPFKGKVKAAINYWRFAFCSKNSLTSKTKKVAIWTLILTPFSFVIHLLDKRK